MWGVRGGLPRRGASCIYGNAWYAGPIATPVPGCWGEIPGRESERKKERERETGKGDGDGAGG